ncbi:hypothetical protein GJ496_011580, partial [Pomphorhynchus laevis]
YNDKCQYIEKLEAEQAQLTTEIDSLGRTKEEEVSKLKQYVSDLEMKIESKDNELRSFNENLSLTINDISCGSEAVEHTSPMSLSSYTKLHNNYLQAVEDLAYKNTEYSKLRESLEIVLQEIKDKSPLLMRQKVNYESAMERNAAMRKSIEALSKQMELLTADASMRSRRYNTVAHENALLKQENKDLAAQIRVLLRQQINESKSSQISDFLMSDTISSSDVISSNFVTFESIDELQEKNQKLLSIVRDLSSSKEQAEEEIIRERTSEVTLTVQHLNKKLDFMEQNMQTYKNTINTLATQRDAYKTLLDKQNESLNEESFDDDSKIAAVRVSQSRVKSLERCVSENRKFMDQQKQQHDAAFQKLQDSNTALEQDCETLKNEIANYKIQLAVAETKLTECDDKIRTYCLNIDNLKSEIDAWLTRYNRLTGRYSELQSSHISLNQSLLCLNEKNRLLESQNKSILCDLDLLKTRSVQVEREKQILKESLECNASFISLADTLKETMEKSSRENRHLLEVQIASLKKDLKNAEEKFNRQEKLKELLISNHKIEIDEHNNAYKIEREAHENTKILLHQEQKRNIVISKEVTELRHKSDAITDPLALRALSGESSIDNEKVALLNEKLSELQVEHRLLKAEMDAQKSLNSELSKSIADYKEMSISLDKNISTQIDEFQKKNSALTSKLEECQHELATKQKEFEDKGDENDKLKCSMDKIEEDYRIKESQLKMKNQEQSNRLLEVMVELESSKAEINRLKSTGKSMSDRLEKENSTMQSLQEQVFTLENDLSSSHENLNKLKNELREVSQNKDRILRERQELSVELQKARDSMKTSNTEYAKLIEENSKRIAAQHAEIEKLALQLSDKYVHNIDSSNEPIDDKYLNLLQSNRIAIKEKGLLEKQLNEARLTIIKLENNLAAVKGTLVLSSSTKDDKDNEHIKMIEKSLSELRNCNQQLIEENRRLQLESQNLMSQVDEKRKQYDTLFISSDSTQSSSRFEQSERSEITDFLGDLIKLSRESIERLPSDASEAVNEIIKQLEILEQKIRQHFKYSQLSEQNLFEITSQLQTKSGKDDISEKDNTIKRGQQPTDESICRKRLKSNVDHQPTTVETSANAEQQAENINTGRNRIQPIIWEEGNQSSLQTLHSEHAFDPPRVIARGLRRGRMPARDDNYGHHHRGIGGRGRLR